MPKNNDPKDCFLIGAIGKEGENVRDHSDWVLHFVTLALETDLGYKVTRADKITNPGTISDQVINRVMDADLVIADLSFHNPNAFYELALRHSVAQPVIHIIETSYEIPFDVSDFRAIKFRLDNPKYMQEAIQNLREHVSAINAAGYTASNPVTRARGVKKLLESSDPSERMLADMKNNITSQAAKIAELESKQHLLELEALYSRSTSRRFARPLVTLPSSSSVSTTSLEEAMIGSDRTITLEIPSTVASLFGQPFRDDTNKKKEPVPKKKDDD